MRIVESHSHLGGLEHLLIHKKEIFEEIRCAVEHSEQNPRAEVSSSLAKRGWVPSGSSRLIKDRVSLEFPDADGIGPESSYPWQAAAYQADLIDVGIEILP